MSYKSLFRKQRFEAQMPTIISKGSKQKIFYETDEQFFKRHGKRRR